MTTTYGELHASAVRLKILQLLRKSGVSINHETLQIALASMGVRIALDQARAELAWLASVGCVTTVPAMHLLVAELTDRGNDVAKGLSQVPGIDVFVPGAGL
jgi:Fe2+ or Zn2+ uptake regulation protein